MSASRTTHRSRFWTPRPEDDEPIVHVPYELEDSPKPGALSRASIDAVRTRSEQIGDAQPAVPDQDGVMDTRPAPLMPRLCDPYAVLGIDPDSTAEVVQAAFRSGYRHARNLADKRAASDRYASLEAALRQIQAEAD